MICVWVTVKVAVVNLVPSVQSVELVAAVEVDVGFLSEPGGASVGGAWSPDREEFISQVTPPETTERVQGQQVSGFICRSRSTSYKNRLYIWQ